MTEIALAIMYLAVTLGWEGFMRREPFEGASRTSVAVAAFILTWAMLVTFFYRIWFN